MARYTIPLIGSGTGSEAVAAAAIYPGQLVELTSAGTVQKQATALADVERAVAVEDSMQGNGIADAYAAVDRVMYRTFKRGDVVLLILKDGEIVAIGGAVEAATGGEVQAYTSGAKLFEAIEANDASDSATTALADRRFAARVI